MPQLEQGEVDLDQLTFKISSSCQIWPLQTQIYYKNAFKTHWLLEKSTDSDPFPVLFPSKYIMSNGKQAKEWATKTIKSLLWIPMTSHKSFWSNTFRTFQIPWIISLANVSGRLSIPLQNGKKLGVVFSERLDPRNYKNPLKKFFT